MLSINFYLPEKIEKDIKAENITIDTEMGEIGIYPEHMKLLTVISIGKMKLEIERQTKIYTISGGILKTQNDKVEIFSSAIEKKEEINIKRAEKAKERAEKYIKQAEEGNKDINYSRAKAALGRAINRLEVASK